MKQSKKIVFQILENLWRLITGKYVFFNQKNVTITVEHVASDIVPLHFCAAKLIALNAEGKIILEELQLVQQQTLQEDYNQTIETFLDDKEMAIKAVIRVGKLMHFLHQLTVGLPVEIRVVTNIRNSDSNTQKSEVFCEILILLVSTMHIKKKFFLTKLPFCL
jgi:hypothetical protein